MESRRRLLVLIVAGLGFAAAAAAPRAAARTLQTRDATLRRVFGAASRFEPRTVWLTRAQSDSVSAWARVKCEPAPVHYWVATRGDSVLGQAFLDTRTVRTMPATVLVAVDRDHRVLAIEVLAFHEPEDYLPRRRWLERLVGRSLSARLRPGADIDGISGATLSARAFAAAVRWALAIDRSVAGEKS